MAQPVVQTIHRDPALLCVAAAVSADSTLTMPQLVDSASHHRGHGARSRYHLRHSLLTSSQILTGILRHYAMILLQNAPKKLALPQIRQQRALVRGINLRANANVLSPTSFQARKAYMVSAYQEGKFLADPESRGKPRPNPMSDPATMEGMMGMMKGNMAMMIPQTLIMGWINAFFSGFVISESTFIHRMIVAAPGPSPDASAPWLATKSLKSGASCLRVSRMSQSCSTGGTIRPESFVFWSRHGHGYAIRHLPSIDFVFPR